MFGFVVNYQLGFLLMCLLMFNDGFMIVVIGSHNGISKIIGQFDQGFLICLEYNCDSGSMQCI